MVDTTMTLDLFAAGVRDQANRFVEFWRATNAQRPDEYPLEMPQERWTEQFLAWCEADEMGMI